MSEVPRLSWIPITAGTPGIEKKQAEAVWGRLETRYVGTSVVGVQQVVLFCSWEADGTPMLSACIDYNVWFSMVLFVPLEKVWP